MADPQGDKAAVSYPLSFYNDPTFSDVQIRFSGHSIYAHKFALSKESRYFYKAFTGGFMVAGSDHIDLRDEDDPKCIIVMLKWIYGVADSPEKQPSRIEKAKKSFNCLPNLFVTADKYDVPGLRNKIVPEFIQSFEALPQAYYGDEDLCSTFSGVFEHVGSHAMQDALFEACCPKTVEMMAHSAFRKMLVGSGSLASKMLANMATYLSMDCVMVWYCNTCEHHVGLFSKCSECKSSPPAHSEIKGRIWDLN